MPPEGTSNGIAIEQSADGRIRLSGRLSTETVPYVLEKSENWFRDHPAVTVDLSAVQSSDSAGVALLLEWLRQARESDCRLRYLNLPRQMQAIVDFGELDEILPLSQETPPQAQADGSA